MNTKDHKAKIERRLTHLNSKGLHLSLDTDIVGIRVMHGDRYLSPRMSARHIVDWLEAFETGFDIGYESGVNSTRKGREEGW